MRIPNGFFTAICDHAIYPLTKYFDVKIVGWQAKYFSTIGEVLQTGFSSEPQRKKCNAAS